MNIMNIMNIHNIKKTSSNDRSRCWGISKLKGGRLFTGSKTVDWEREKGLASKEKKSIPQQEAKYIFNKEN